MSSENRPFAPLLARHGMDKRDYSVRSKDVESHLTDPLWNWCRPYVASRKSGTNSYVLNPRGRRMCIALRLTVSSVSDLEDFTSRKPNALLNMADWLLQNNDSPDYELLRLDHLEQMLNEGGSAWQVAPDSKSLIDQLEQMLDEGGSAWRVAPDGKSLIERTLGAEHTAVELAAQGDDQIAADIHTAWSAAWRREEPSAVEAYAAAVKAVEGVLAPIVTPDDPKPSLGKIIPALRNKPEKWDTRFRGVETVEALADMLDEVWRSQHRHGGGAELPNTLDEARDAVSIAVAVVGLCRRGFLERLDELTPDEEATDREWAAELRREIDEDGAGDTIPIEELFADQRASGE